MVVLRRDTTYLLQRRAVGQGGLYTGLVGFFGGKVEPEDASTHHAAQRELTEETSFAPKIEELRYIGCVSVAIDATGRPRQVDAEVFEADVPTGAEVIALDGTLETWTAEEVLRRRSELTPATEAALDELIGWDAA